MKYTDFKNCDIIIGIATYSGSLTQCWRLETSSRPFYDFIKMTIYQDLPIFHSSYLPFLNVPYSPFQKNETLES